MSGREQPIPDGLMHAFGARVRARREVLNLTQHDLAEVSAVVGRTSITNIEAGRQAPTLAAYVALCRVAPGRSRPAVAGAALRAVRRRSTTRLSVQHVRCWRTARHLGGHRWPVTRATRGD